jgi:hypothetical protein
MRIYKTNHAKLKFDLKILAKSVKERGYDAIEFPDGEVMLI